MKLKHILFIALLGCICSSCNDLELEPKGILGEAELFGNEFGVKKYFTGIYNNLPIEDFNYYSRSGNPDNGETGYRPGNYWEAGKFSQMNMSGEAINSWILVNNNGFGYWPYNHIREVNTFIVNFPKYKSSYDDPLYNALLGEAYFLRAYYYFGLAKRYGGVPIVTDVQDPTSTDKELLNVKRATEYDTWKFIHDDLQFAITNMKATTEIGRANKYAAAALMSRTMLYAATIAKYTQYLGYDTELAYQQGFAGIDPSKANEFFQYAYDAGKLIDNSGQYSLYTKNYPDKATNYANIFIDASSPENIFIKDYDQTVPGDTRLRHSYDAMMCPNPDMSSFVGAQSYPPLDLMRMYDFPAIVDAEGKPIRFDERSDIRNGMEPRMRGTMYFDGDELRGKTFSIQRGIYVSFPGPASDAQDGSNNAPINAQSNRILGRRGQLYDDKYPVTGNHGMFDNEGMENNCRSGAFIRKYINPSMPTSDVREYRSGQPWIVFRLGEIYLNLAEAAYELGNKTEAFDYIEKIRERAGAKVTRPADDPTDLSAIYGYPIDGNLQFIRDERYRELAFENHRWWDLRRWRTVDRVLNNWRARVLMCYFIPDEGKYIYLDEWEKDNRRWTASKSSFYEGIPQGEINKNNNLLPQNPLR